MINDEKENNEGEGAVSDQAWREDCSQGLENIRVAMHQRRGEIYPGNCGTSRRIAQHGVDMAAGIPVIMNKEGVYSCFTMAAIALTAYLWPLTLYPALSYYPAHD